MTSTVEENTAAPEVPGKLIAAIEAMRAPVVLAHVIPDADALGSMLAMAMGWASDTWRAKVSLPPGSISQRLTFLRHYAEVTEATPKDFSAADGFIVLDTAKRSRCNLDPALKELDWSADKPLVNIDHHATNTQYGTVNWVVGTAGSTCELVYYVLTAAGRPMTPMMASLLYAGIQTDTLGFSLPTVSASTLHAAGALIDAGADVGDLGERLCRSQSASEFALLRVVYDHTKVVADGRLAYSFAGFEDIRNAGCAAADVDEQINVPRSLEGVQLALLFTEGIRGKTRINFRSSGQFTVLELAAKFHGGGHSQSAGAVLDCGLQEGMDQVLPAAIEHLKQFA